MKIYVLHYVSNYGITSVCLFACLYFDEWRRIGLLIRHATVADASGIAEILIFSKRANYRNIFQNDYERHGFVLTGEKQPEEGKPEYILRMER